MLLPTAIFLPKLSTLHFRSRTSQLRCQVLVSLISDVAKAAKVNLFRRWALMRHWHVHNDIGLDRMFDPTDPDKLHQSEWSTLRFAQALRDAITRAPPPSA